MTQHPSSVAAAFAPNGILRASINLGNPILAGRDAATGEAVGVSVDLARALARELDRPLELVLFETAGNSVDAVRAERADVGFFAIDPLRGDGISFTAPYVLIEGAYLVKQDSALQSNDEVDFAGLRVTVGKGSAYDLFLTRELKSAEIVRAVSSPAVVDTFLDQGCDVAAGVRQQLEADAKRLPGLRLLPGRFMVIRQAMGVPSSRGDQATAYLRDFVARQIRSGFVGEALARHRVQGVSVAPDPAA